MEQAGHSELSSLLICVLPCLLLQEGTLWSSAWCFHKHTAGCDGAAPLCSAGSGTLIITI